MNFTIPLILYHKKKIIQLRRYHVPTDKSGTVRVSLYSYIHKHKAVRRVRNESRGEANENNESSSPPAKINSPYPYLGQEGIGSKSRSRYANQERGWLEREEFLCLGFYLAVQAE